MKILILCLIVFYFFTVIYAKNISKHRNIEEKVSSHHRFKRNEEEGYTPDGKKIQPVPVYCVRNERGEWANCQKLFKNKDIDYMMPCCYGILVENCIIKDIDKPECKNLLWNNYDKSAVKESCRHFIDTCGFYIPSLGDDY